MIGAAWLALLCCLPLLAPGCSRPVLFADAGPSELFLPETPLKDIDILFVIDSSGSMGILQETISRDFPALVDGLRCPSLQGKLPNLHIGIVTSDLGAGTYGLPSCETAGGDGGKLQARPRLPGCTAPAQPFIAHVEGVTNIPSPTTDPVQQVKEAFKCIAKVGSAGCGFVHQLESARRALDPGLNVNPGFVREEALLAVVFFTDQDDCSAQKPQLFDPSQSDPLGPLTSFRCFEFGVQCNINDRTKPGPRIDCRPAHDWLHKVGSYVTFFDGLKPFGRLILFAVAGPTDKVEVGMDAQNPVLRPSCQTSAARAGPAIRIRAVVDGVRARGSRGHFDDPVDICSPDLGPAMRRLARVIRDALGR